MLSPIDNEPSAAALDFVQHGRATRRYHGLLMREHQRVDAHSYGVAVLTTFLTAGDADDARRARLLQAALYHDLPEWVSGDMPAPFKRAYPEVRKLLHNYDEGMLRDAGLHIELNERDSRVLKLADAAEGCLHCIEERKLGNLTIADRAFYAFWGYCMDEQRLGGHPKWKERGEKPLRHYIASEWAKYNGGW